MAQTLTFVQRLLDVFPVVQSDLRIQMVFTVAPHAFGEGVPQFLHARGIPVLPWEEAVRSDFDLALAAGWEEIDQVRAPVVLLSHGAGQIKVQRVWNGAATEERPPGMLSRDNLTRKGSVVPAAVGLAHRNDLKTLARTCPEAVPVATVLGDPTYDRLVASLPHRGAYRAALGLTEGQKLVVVTATWGQWASFGALDALLPRLLTELPGQTYRVAVLTHPNISAGHGWWQVQTWLSAYHRRGVAVIPPDVDWRPVMASADWVLGDHGSLTTYATLTPAPILMVRFPYDKVHRASPAAGLAKTAPTLFPGHPVEEQLHYAATEYRRKDYAAIAGQISSAPGRFNERLRRLVYRMLGIGQPAYPPVTEPVSVPASLDGWTGKALGDVA